MNRLLAFSYMVCGLSLGSLSQLQAAPVIDALLKTPIAVPQATDADDYLLEMARNADINVLSDATHSPPAAPITPFPETLVAMFTAEKGLTSAKVREPTLLNVMVDLTQQQKLSLYRLQRNTFLLWSEPETPSKLELARQSAAGGGIQMPPTALNDLPNLEIQKTLRAALATYLEKTQGWHGAVLNPPVDVKFTDLPEPIRRQVTTLAWRTLLNGQSGLATWLTEKPWPQARLRITKTHAQDGDHLNTEKMEVVSEVGGEQQSVSINMR